MTPLKLPVAKKPWIMVGRYHICMGAAGIGTRPIRMVTYIMSGIIIEFSHNGIIRIGFHTTGAPNTIGSLMLKIAGKMVTVADGLQSLTLGSHAKDNQSKGRALSADVSDTHQSLHQVDVGSCLSCRYGCILASIPVIQIAHAIGNRIQVNPKEYRKQVKKLTSTTPYQV